MLKRSWIVAGVALAVTTTGPVVAVEDNGNPTHGDRAQAVGWPHPPSRGEIGEARGMARRAVVVAGATTCRTVDGFAGRYQCFVAHRGGRGGWHVKVRVFEDGSGWSRVGRWPAQAPSLALRMRASAYSLIGYRTAAGARVQPWTMFVAHRSLPFGTRLVITDGRRWTQAVVMDRGPFVRGRDLDLGTGVWRALGYPSATAFGVRTVTVVVR